MTGTIGNHHDEYVAAPLAQKHQWMHTGKGIAATQSAAEALGQLVPKFAEHATALQAGMQKLGIAWSGEAATAATTKLQQAASWAEQAGHTSTAGHASVQTYGDSFANTVPRIPEPKPEPDTGAWGNIEDFLCATRRTVVSPAQPGGTRREVPGSDGLPDAERLRGQEHAS